MKPQLFIGTRFGLSVRDPAWFDHRLPLFSSITVPSLLAQEDQGFQWAIFVDPGLPVGVRDALEEMLTPFGGRAFIHSADPFSSDRIMPLVQARGAVTADGCVLTGRIDDDDAWSIGTVGMVRERAMTWMENQDETEGVCMTFERGLEWVMYDMIDIDQREQGYKVVREGAVRPLDFPFHSMSIFVCSKLTGGEVMISAPHLRMGDQMKERGLAVDVVQTDKPMWVYCRHKQVQSDTQRARTDQIDFSLSDLEREFGIDAGRTASYLASADEHGYAVMRRTDSLLIHLDNQLRKVRRQLENSPTSDPETAQLRQKEQELADELAGISENMVGDPEEVFTPLEEG